MRAVCNRNTGARAVKGGATEVKAVDREEYRSGSSLEVARCRDESCGQVGGCEEVRAVVRSGWVPR